MTKLARGNFPARRRHGRCAFRPRLQLLEDRTVPNSGVGFVDSGTSTWHLRSTASPGDFDVGTFQQGAEGTVPIVGDWNGDGIDDTGTFDRDTATWSLHYGLSAGAADAGVFQFGRPDSIPVVGDWNGDGRDDIGTFFKGTWSLRYGASPGPANAGTFNFGDKNGVPVAGDWDGDGRDGIGTFTKSKLTWILRQTADAGPASATFTFGVKGADPVVGDWNGDGIDGIGVFHRDTATWSLRQTATAGTADVGTFVLGNNQSDPIVGDFTNPTASVDPLLALSLPPLDVNLLGLQVTSSPITATVSAEAGDGKLVGNLLSTVPNVVNVDQINASLNSVLTTVVNLLNSHDLTLAGVLNGPFTHPDPSLPASAQVLELFVAPVHVDLLGARVDTSPIRLAITAHQGEGLVLGNILTYLTHLFGPDDQLNLDTINTKLEKLLSDIQAQIPGIPPADAPPPVLTDNQFLALTVPALNVNLLGLMLKTDPITVDGSATRGDGLLLGNVLNAVFDTLDATPEQLTRLNDNINDVLAQLVGFLNSATLTLPPDAVNGLSDALKQLSLPDLISATPGQTAGILDLVIASPDNTPVKVDLLGLNVTSTNVNAQLSAQTGDGLVLGNLLYNLANLVNPGGPASLISLLTQLGSGTTSNLFDVVNDLSPTITSTDVLTLTLPPLDIDLLGVELQTDAPITITVNAQEGEGLLLGNILTPLSMLLNTQGVGNALNAVIGTVATLLNENDLVVSGVQDGPFSSPDPALPASTPVLDLSVAPVHLDLLGAVADTSAIHLKVTAHQGTDLVLGNLLTKLTYLFGPNDQLDLATINDKLEQLLTDVRTQIPDIPPADSPPPVLGPGQFLALTVPALNVNLLGLMLTSDPITVNATAQTGDGMLLGNLLNAVFNALDATPEERSRFNKDVNDILAVVVGVLNAARLEVPPDVLLTLPPAIQTLAAPLLISPTPGATASILNLVITAPDGTTTPVDVNLLGLLVTTSNIRVDLSAQTGDGLILGNLLYNLAHLLDPGSELLTLLGDLGL